MVVISLPGVGWLMKRLSVKRVPEEWVQRLRERAKQHDCSLQGELMAIFEGSVGGRPITFRELYDEAASWGFSTPSESVTMIHEDRDAR